MADKSFMSPRRGGTRAEVNRTGVYVAPDPVEAVPVTASKPRSLRGSNDAVPASAYSHDKKKRSVVDSRNIDINFQSNILDNFDSYTYHFKLFITSLDDASSGQVLNPASQTIIAESGVSDLTIDKIELNGIAVPSIQAGTGTQTLIKFEITEPSGAGLLDKMYYEAISLGIGNWLVMPCFLQLEFKGRDPETQEAVTTGSASSLDGLKWIWPIKLTNAKANVTLVGTRYEFDAIVYDELAQSSSYFAIQHNIVLEGLTNFGNAMDDLQKKLNADQYEKLLDNYSIPDTYNIVVDPDLRKSQIAVVDSNKSTSRGGSFVDLGKKAATYNHGTGIDKIVDSLLGSSPDFQDSLQSSSTPTAEPDSANKAEPMRKLWRIITETKPIGFDPLRQDNAVAITIYIVPYDIGLIEATPAQTGQTSDTLIAARKRLATYASNGILRKKYNYIFTGLNDQIVSFDLNMNFSFAASLSRFGGVFYDTAGSDKGISQQENAKNEQEVTEKVRNTLRFVNNPATANNADIEIAATISSIQASNISPELKAKYTRILANAKPADRISFGKQLAVLGGLNNNGTVGTVVDDPDGTYIETRGIARSLATNKNSEHNFISDVDIYSSTSQNAKEIALASRRGKLRPIPYREGMQEINLSYSVDPQSDAGRSRTASVFSTALYSTLDASLQQVKLTIKGDPFWLFPANVSGQLEVLPYKSNMSDEDAIKLIKQGHIDNPQSVNFFGTDNFIVIRFRTPRIYNETTGLNEPYSEVETFSGVYKVITIVSRFVMGKFTQELTCILDNLINLTDFPEFLRNIERANAAPDVTISPDQNAAETNRLLRTSLPDTVIKTDRILPGE